MKLKIIDKPLDALKPYENNPRNNDEAVQPVAESIKQFGFKVPIIIDAQGVIIAGHTRYRAAQFLELKTVPCIVANDLTPEQIQAFRVADNKTAEFAEWDMELLNEELKSITAFDIDMSAFGFEDIEIYERDLDEFFTAAPMPHNPQTNTQQSQIVNDSGEDGDESEDEKPPSITCPKCGEVFSK